MGVEHPEALGLEQKCIRPGHWVIEGRTVYRLDGTWCIYDGTWRYFLPLSHVPVHCSDTLARARDWIREQIGRG